MKRPIGLNESLVPLVEGAVDGKELFERAVKESDEVIANLLEFGCDDKTWIEERGGGAFIEPMLSWVTKKFRNEAIPWSIARRICKSVRDNYPHLEKYLIKDVTFVVEGERFAENSLLFRIAGAPYFDLIDDEMELDEFTGQLFTWTEEFINSGAIKDLWKAPSKDILALIELANNLEMTRLGEYGFEIYKKYIEKEMLFKRLMQAFDEQMDDLVAELCELADKEHMGFTLRFDGELLLTLDHVWEEEQPYLVMVMPKVDRLVLADLGRNIELLTSLREKVSSLKKIDLSASKGVDDHQWELFLDAYSGCAIEELILRECEWVDDTRLKELIKAFPKLRKLDLSRVPEISYAGLGALEGLSELDLLFLDDLSAVGDAEVGIILEAAPNLRELSLKGCRNVTEIALEGAACQILR